MMYFSKKLVKVTGAQVQRGFTLLIAVILTSVILAVGLALLDISVKQVTLASVARQSQYAFYNADSALECALYYDTADTFDYSSEPLSGTLALCAGQQSVAYTSTGPSSGVNTTTFGVPCTGDNTSGDYSAFVTVTKASTGATHFYSNGYNTCVASDKTRVERGLEAKY
jgi:Tfp pilus assembly protein PilX